LSTWNFIEPLQEPVHFDEVFFELLPKERRIQQVAHPDPDARHLVGVGRPDSTSRRPDLARPFGLLGRPIDGLVIGQNEVRPLADDEILPDDDALGL
jgi:hypothetical protein